MPGGKIAVNRGLLYELDSEAELAAVLGHEIVHAAARHGAKSMERGVFLQGAALAVGVLAADTHYSNLILGSGKVGMQLISTKYGRDAESEADLYGMHYMKLAGYDPSAAVTLQETFVRLSKDRNSSFLEGLFASHPPSVERVNANKVTLAQVGAGGEWGREIYAQKVGKLKATQTAYKAYDDGVKVLAKGNAKQAIKLAKQAIAGEPREARFQELLGDIALSQKNPTEALGFYKKAIQMQPDYFKPQVQCGVALVDLGRKSEAEAYFKRGNALLPNAQSYYYLGEIAEERGDLTGALQSYQAAADSDSVIGKASVERYVRLDLPNNPERYLRGMPRLDVNGNVYAIVENTSALAVSRVQLRIVRYDQRSRQPIEQSRPMFIASIAANSQAQIQVVGLRLNTEAELQSYRVVIEGVELADAQSTR
ncbi:beta-barrel assembly-enhancing protease precursor [mine drainage metagenome]|uniref:Beta-barrel assembly-enhancing protease n=1 Tax=mine drainage metagenome TaxID=410659 RepID=A0A1J5S0G1_9ZZZZ